MKKTVINLSLTLCALMLLSCGPAAELPQTPAPAETAEVVATEKPVMAIDDSLSFRGQMGETNEPFKAAYTEKMAQYIDGLEVLEVETFCFVGFNYPMWCCGCFTFTGTPKPELGWEQQDVYCRSFNIRTEDGENWSFAKSYPMERCETLKSFVYGDDWSIINCDTTVSGLASAELYVSQLGESYTVTESAALRKLEAALSQMRYGEWNSGSGAPEIECGFVNPLYLRYADGSKKLVLTAGDGSDACYIWDGWYVYNDGESIFERFGVPIEAAGYEREDGLTRTKYSFEYKDATRLKSSVAYIEHLYDAGGRLVQSDTYYDPAVPYAGDTVQTRFERDYDGDGRLIEEREYLKTSQPDLGKYTKSSADLELWGTYLYEYSADGLLTKRTTVFSGILRGVEAGVSVIEEYEYDQQGRLILIRSSYPRDEGGPSSRETLYWYDDEGYRRAYACDENGNLIGNTPIRREG